ncbi:MAG TPA: OmpA family protein [Burkholderiales bacterium]|nr:OmpA family protein [Burkholderiales bacterium]
MNASLKAACATVVCMAALAPVLAHAQFLNEGYLTDKDGNVVKAVGNTVCIRTSAWTPALAAAAAACKECTPDLCPKPPPPPPPPPKPPAKEPPKPVVKAPPEKLLPQKINFSADALFDFDKADLRPDGKAMLDDLARLLQGAKYEVILAIGHADRIGTVQYNQRLSVRRAETVKKYLVDKGIEPNRVYAEGKGKSQPLTKPGECTVKNRKALIACLQPDRRVDVEVTGTK